MIEEALRTQSCNDEVGDLGVERGRQAGADCSHDIIGVIRLCVDDQGSTCFKVDEYVAAVGIDADRDQRQARSTDQPCVVGSVLT